MTDQNRQQNARNVGQSTPEAASKEDTVEWRHIFEPDGDTAEQASIAGEVIDLDDLDATEELDAQRNAFEALRRAGDLLVGLSDPLDEAIPRYVTELPEWFQGSTQVEAAIQVGDRTFETDGFHSTPDPLSAEDTTRTGTPVSLTVVCEGGRRATGHGTWLATERELVANLTALITDRVGQWELDSLRNVSDGLVALDGDLRYTYVNAAAERILEHTSEELCGERIWDVFPSAIDTGFQDSVERALETQSPTSIEQYYTAAEKMVEARIHPVDEGIVVAFTEKTGPDVAEREIDRILETAPCGIVLLDGQGEITYANGRAEGLLGLSRDSMNRVGYDDPDWDIWDESGDAIPVSDHPVTQVLATGEAVQGFTHGFTLPDGTDRWLSSNVAPIESDDGAVEQVVVALDDITDLKRVEGLAQTFRNVSDVLNAAEERQDSETAVCELLTEGRDYQYARVDSHTNGSEVTTSSLESTTSPGAPDRVDTQEGPSETELEPIRAAIETGTTQVVADWQTDPAFPSWRESTLDRGYKGGAIVPLRHRDRIHGILVLYTDRSGAFEAREQALLTSSGDRIGHAFHSLEADRLLHADDLLELTFRSRDPTSLFVSLSEELDCTIDITQTTRVASDRVVQYGTVAGAPLAAVSERVSSMDPDAEMRLLRAVETPPGGAFEIDRQPQSLAHTLVTQGAVVTSNTISDGRAEVVCDLPLGHDIESLVGRIEESFRETWLLAKRTDTRPRRSESRLVSQRLGDIFDEELTDRQQQVLRAAIYGGYFESPRRSSGTEIAETLSMTQSTFAYHLRNAQRTLFQTLLERFEH